MPLLQVLQLPQMVLQPVGQPIGQSMGQAMGQSIGQPMGQALGQPLSQPVGQSMGQSMGQPLVVPSPGLQFSPVLEVGVGWWQDTLESRIVGEGWQLIGSLFCISTLLLEQYPLIKKSPKK